MDRLDFFRKIEQAVTSKYMPLVEKAVAFAEKIHKGQKRLTGEDYVEHPLRSTLILAEWKLDPDTIVAGILHDVLEDSNTTVDEIEKSFGKNIAFLVEGVTKLGRLSYQGRERYAESLRKLFIAMSSDIRVIMIKIADRLDNIKTLHVFETSKQLRIARETLEIYAPIANRLGMGEIKGQLEDLAFPIAQKRDYLKLKELVKETYGSQEKLVNKKVIPQIKKILKKVNINVIDIHGRAKRLYSLYKKLKKYDNDLSRIHDIIAVRIIVPDVSSCYTALGAIHSECAPIKGRIKDYIAQPKPNGYRSLHTDIFCLDNRIVEIQIRDQEMHHAAEFGIAAHWNYVETGKPKKGTPVKKRLEWINHLMQWQKSIADNDKYIEGLKIDIFKNRIFIFTPKGDVIDLPENSTPIDFAYAIHTDLGNHTTGAKINEKIGKLTSTLQNGDLVEIIKSKNRKKPSRDWLNHIQTHRARTGIIAQLNKK
ncbi:RelA/SpoT family protein [Patescibacteria group bacterium]